MKTKEIYQKLLSEKGKSKNFAQYNKLSDYQKQCLYNSNYWRLQTGNEVIAVPESDENYWQELEKNFEKCLEED
ncbi:hypothetical protein KMW28_15590 [Flammeovirga yaeyamensis]|uniref:Uncharacterized protein n=1 Tax=Flammeovirga yaeyamensis TaxID=367791 RepID=A0AAX1N0L4_9BACT|nr:MULTISPECIES: hypothetical protein [Flammeovirga]ANQ47525.1 hypothetical protein MY04_0143 [Flammeovirga sp. MY04]MBB3698564.1 hypothetical protein [Flammeovirga yaeyamensis]NMF34087.1 hypothetical protein [Flammeovirga yaeyamensis]QWG01075.1 hypothetical protein KMW28_15590 [Flammeovirga yaeyamensis]